MFLSRLVEWRLLFSAFLVRNKFHRLATMLAGTRLYSSLQTYNDVDVFVSTGGTYLSENYDLRVRLLELRVLSMLRKPLLFLTQSMGPFKQRRNIKILGSILQGASLVLVRDDLSRRHVHEMGVRCNIMEAPDTAFALQLPRSPVPKESMVRPRIAISVRRWKHFKSISQDDGMRRYMDAIGNLVSQLVAQNQAEITFLSTCQGVEKYPFDDAAVADEIVAGLPLEVRSSVVVNHEFHSAETLIAELEKFDVAVSTRMHFAILSLVAGIPVVPISYEFKTTELFIRLGLERQLDCQSLSLRFQIEFVHFLLFHQPTPFG